MGGAGSWWGRHTGGFNVLLTCGFHSYNSQLELNGTVYKNIHFDTGKCLASIRNLARTVECSCLWWVEWRNVILQNCRFWECVYCPWFRWNISETILIFDPILETKCTASGFKNFNETSSYSKDPLFYSLHLKNLCTLCVNPSQNYRIQKTSYHKMINS